MTILIADSSVIIDLERGDLLELAFSCGLVLAVPDVLYMAELEGHNGVYLRSLGLAVLPLNPEELAFAQDLNAGRPALSLSDCFALTCARRAQHELLTGDGNLRREATDRGVAVHGLLWLLDAMLATGQIAPAALHQGLSAISADSRCRLPGDEVKRRLKGWELGQAD